MEPQRWTRLLKLTGRWKYNGIMWLPLCKDFSNPPSNQYPYVINYWPLTYFYGKALYVLLNSWSNLNIFKLMSIGTFFYLKMIMLCVEIVNFLSWGNMYINQIYGLQLPREPHRSTRLLQPTDRWQYNWIIWLPIRSVKSNNVDFLNQIRYFSIK